MNLFNQSSEDFSTENYKTIKNGIEDIVNRYPVLME